MQFKENYRSCLVWVSWVEDSITQGMDLCSLLLDLPWNCRLTWNLDQRFQMYSIGYSGWVSYKLQGSSLWLWPWTMVWYRVLNLYWVLQSLYRDSLRTQRNLTCLQVQPIHSFEPSFIRHRSSDEPRYLVNFPVCMVGKRCVCSLPCKNKP